MDDQVIRIDRVCRGCLREELHMQPLFSTCGEAREPRLNQMLMSSTQIQVAENDGLPCQICVHCTYQLSSAFTFKQMCERSDAKLRNFVSKTKSTTKMLPSSVQNLEAPVKQEGIALQQNANNEIIDFNTMFNHDMNAIKMERDNSESQSTKCDDDKKSIGLKNSLSEGPLNLINSIEKCTQTKNFDLIQKLFNCSACAKKFSSLIGLTNHMKWRHSMKDLVPCKDCDKIFPKHSHLKKHSLEVHGKELSEELKVLLPLDCQMCKKEFLNINQLKQHMLVHGKKKIFNCENCQHGFNKLENFEKHKILCEQKTNLCGICNKKFSSEEILSLHIETMHPNKDDIPSKKEDCSIFDAAAPQTNGHSNNPVPGEILCSEIGFEDGELNIKEEPLEQLLEEAERENQLINENSLGDCNDDDIPSLGDYSETIESDASEYIGEIKMKRKLNRLNKPNRKFKYKLMKQSENDPHSLKYQCSQCPRKLPTSLGLKIHMAKHYSDQGLLYKCEDCGKAFSKSTELKKHERTHNSIKNFKCDSCDKSFHRQDNLERHMWQHMDNKPHQCDECSKGFMRIEHLAKHKVAIHSGKKKNPKTAFCPICNRGFTTEKYLETHMRMHTGDKTFTCKVCDKSFNTKWHLKEHGKWHSAEKPFLCSECGQRFIRNDYLITHMRRHNGEKPYKCRFCGKGFPRATDLTVHERYHTGEKTHLCTVCGKGFQRQYNLTVHLRVHTGEKPYVCSYCGKKFAQGNDLKSHVRRHTGERFNCEICGDGFIQGYHLTQHKRSMHGIQCVSHIRRVEKHPQSNAQNLNIAKHRVRPVQQLNAAHLATNISNQLQQTTNASSQNVTVPAENQTSLPSQLNSRCIENETINIPQHHSVSLQSQLAAVQSAAAEVDLSQRTHPMPALMPIVPLAIFSNIHNRI